MLGTFENARVVAIRQSAGIHLLRTLLLLQHTVATHGILMQNRLIAVYSLLVPAYLFRCMQLLKHACCHTQAHLSGIESESPVAVRQAVAAACLTTPVSTVDRVYQDSVLR